MSTTTRMRQAGAGRTAHAHVVVWCGLVAITGIEVLFASEQWRPALLLGVLSGLSIVQAALIVSYFMRLKFEKSQLALWLVPAVIFCVGIMMIFFFPDSYRLLQMRQ